MISGLTKKKITLAYAVRSLSGMIYNVGLLPQNKLSKVEQAYQLYRFRGENGRPNGADAIKFRQKYQCKMPSIHFLGCFDTVGALGVPKLPWFLGGSVCKSQLIFKGEKN